MRSICSLRPSTPRAQGPRSAQKHRGAMPRRKNSGAGPQRLSERDAQEQSFAQVEGITGQGAGYAHLCLWAFSRVLAAPAARAAPFSAATTACVAPCIVRAGGYARPAFGRVVPLLPAAPTRVKRTVVASHPFAGGKPRRGSGVSRLCPVPALAASPTTADAAARGPTSKRLSRRRRPRTKRMMPTSGRRHGRTSTKRTSQVGACRMPPSRRRRTQVPVPALETPPLTPACGRQHGCGRRLLPRRPRRRRASTLRASRAATLSSLMAGPTESSGCTPGARRAPRTGA